MAETPNLNAILPLALLAICAACGGGASSASGTGSATPAPTTVVTVPQPIAGDVERTSFAPSLDVDFAKMSRRASGLYVQDVKLGTGAVAGREKTIAVRYTGWLPSGKEFDHGEISVTLGKNSVVRAWEEGLLGMRVGGIRRLVSPPNMAYGSRGAGDDIPPNAVLVFQMEVVSVF